jgi:putative ABC transport system permease protein
MALPQLLRLGVAEASAAGVAGVLLGIGAALVVGRFAFGSSSFGADPRATLLDLGLAALVGLGIATLAVAVPAWRDARSLTVASATRRVSRGRGASAAVLVAAILLLAAALVVDLLVQRTGYELVLAPEGVPAVSITYWALLGPLCLWLGAALLVWWLARSLLLRGRAGLATLAGPLAGPLAGAVAGSLSRQHRLLARALLLVALAGAFAVATAVFNSTYAQQSEVDARLTNGGDVTVTEPPTAAVPASFAARLAATPGVVGVEPIQHRFAYVGADLQDLYGVRPSTVVAATKLQDAYFSGGTADQLVGRLGREPDGILVSAETVKDFQLQPGDRLTLRLRDGRTGDLVPVSFHYVGVVKEFPTAPRDSFMVANASYVARVTGSDAVGSFLIDTGGSSPSAVSARVRAAVGGSATVTDIASARRVLGSSLTALDLRGLTRLELGFALVLAAAGAGVVPALALAERRHRFAVLVALGASSRQVGAFIVAEAILVTVGGIVAGAALGAALAELLVAVLTGIFDPPPSSLAVPWGHLLGVTAVLLAAAVAAGAWTLLSSRASPIDHLRTG